MSAHDSGPRTQFFLGTGATMGRTGAAPAAVLQDADGDTVLTFVNADVREVVRSILGDILRVPYALDPRVQGTVSLQTRQSIDREALLPLLETVLSLNGLRLVQTDGVYTVVPSGDALRHGAPIGRGGTLGSVNPAFSIHVVPLRFTSATEMQNVLKAIASPEMTIQSMPNRNLLIVAGTRREIASLLEMVELFDVNWLAGTSFALFRPKNADAKALIKELEIVFGGDRDAGTGLIRFFPIERLNAILATTRTPTYLHEAAGWVERLDHSSELVDRRIFVYYVQNGRAVDLAASLNRLLADNTTEGGPEPARGQIEPLVDPNLAQGLPVPLVPPANQRTQPPLQGPDTTAPAQPSPPERPEGPEAAPADGEGIRLGAPVSARVIANEENNALLVLATPREYRVIEAALAKLDVPPLQVLIEAVVAEVTLTTDLRYGVQWFFQLGSTSLTFSEASNGAVLPQFPGFAAVATSGSDIRAVLSALETVTKVNVLSSPQLMVRNNQTATLQVGDQVPIATQSATSVLVPGAPIVNTIQFRDTGVILKVTPRVNEGGLVLMDISQEVSDVSRTTTSGIDSPTIQQRKFNSTVSVQNGETIALGGLIRDRRIADNSGIPVLKDVPILGHLFKSTGNFDTRTELVVLITPRVVRTTADIRAVTEEFRERLRALSAPPR